MSHSVNVSPEARAKDAAFLQERAASGKEKYIVRHSKQARFTHGITVIACILHERDEPQAGCLRVGR